MGKKPLSSEFSITEFLNKKEEKTDDALELPKEENLPNDHFTQTDLDTEWKKFLVDLQQNDTVTYNAINGFRLYKRDENIIEILYPSDLAKAEFEKIGDQFFNHFKHKVNHFNLVLEFKNDVRLKKEVVTKKSIFEKMVQINPVLKDLDDLLKFDLS